MKPEHLKEIPINYENIYFFGSRSLGNGSETEDSDWDYIIQVKDGPNPLDHIELYKSGFRLGANYPKHFPLHAWRKELSNYDNLNLIICYGPYILEKYMKANEILKLLPPLDKETRIKVFEAISRPS